MGLDMFLSRRTYVKNWEHTPIERRTSITIIREGQPVKGIDTTKISYIIEEVGYWRKANHIHNWFVNHVQNGKDDCKEYYVSPENLKELLSICERIKAECPLVRGTVENGATLVEDAWVPNLEPGEIMTNVELAKKLLPTTSGFFFGSTSYDQWYMRDILDTIEILTPLVTEEYEGDIYYQSSW